MKSSGVTGQPEASAPSRREWMRASMAIAAVSALFLSPALLTSRVLLPADLLASYAPWATEAANVPQNANLSDSLQQFYPYLHFFREQMRRGHFPLWNPYVLCGTPFLANSVTAVLFPITWLVLAIPPETFFEWSAFLKLFLAGLGTYAFARARLSVRPPAAWCAATAYMFCGYQVYFLGFPNTYITALLPWSLLALEAGFVGPNIRCRWVFSLLVAALLVAGHVESAVLAILFFLLYLGVLVFESGPRRMQDSLNIGQSLMPFLLHLVWAAFLAGAALLPFAAYLRESATFLNRTQAVNPFHVPLLRLPAMLVPYFFGSPVFNPSGATVGQMEQCIFIGAIPLLLAFYGMSRSANWRAPAIIAGFILSFLITFGIWPFFHLFTSLPILKQGNHVHAIQIFQFCSVLLLAMGLERWAGMNRKLRTLPALFLAVQLALLLWQSRLHTQFPFLTFQTKTPWYGVISLCFLILFCATQLKPATAPGLLAVLLPGLGFLYGYCFNPAASSHLLEPHAALRQMEQSARLAGIGDGTLLPNMSLSAGLRDFRGYESVVLSRTQTFFNRLTGRINDPQHSLHQVDSGVATVLRQCGVQYLVSPSPLMLPAWTRLEARGAFVYRALEPASRTQFVSRARSATAADSLTALLEGRTENMLFLEKEGLDRRGSASGMVRTLREMPDRMQYAVHAAAAGFLLVREAADGGWGARVNGRPAEWVRANYLFMAIAVPAGDSVVELNYRPWSWIGGLALTLL
ncbi:MAG: YfhO family protein, partial [Acidobacteria bacterium]|nr:YfhO family protein [Acidobacteriota bacterium]